MSHEYGIRDPSQILRRASASPRLGLSRSAVPDKLLNIVYDRNQRRGLRLVASKLHETEHALHELTAVFASTAYLDQQFPHARRVFGFPVRQFARFTTPTRGLLIWCAIS